MCPSRTFSNYANSDDRWLRVTRFRDTKARYIHNGAISRRDGYRTQGECGTCFREISAGYGLASCRRDEAAGTREESRNRAPEQHHRHGERRARRREMRRALRVYIIRLRVQRCGAAPRGRGRFGAIEIRVVKARRGVCGGARDESSHPAPLVWANAVPVGEGLQRPIQFEALCRRGCPARACARSNERRGYYERRRTEDEPRGLCAPYSPCYLNHPEAHVCAGRHEPRILAHVYSARPQ